MFPNIWFIVSGVLLGASYFIDMNIREYNEQRNVSKPNTIFVQTVFSSCNTTEQCTYLYKY